MACNPHVQTQPRARWLIVVLLLVLSVLLAACGGTPQAKTYTIGVVNYVPSLDQVLGGFKVRMAELGYVEGKNVIYIYHGVTAPDPQSMDREVKSLQEQKIDMFLTMGTLPTLTAKSAVAGTDTPVVFAPVINPVEEGAVESINHPGGNVTGVQNGYTTAKALEWLHKIVPQATKIYVVYNPKDAVALTSIKSFPEVASKLGFELVLDEVHTREEAMSAINAMPKDTALFLVPTPSLIPMAPFIETAVKRGIAVGTNSHGDLESGAVVTYAASFSAMGNQAARMADQIFKGTKPADLPVETAEFLMKINLKTAQAIDLDIPDAILKQAAEVVR
jgi:putative tryptophan/tyrosine transport system substrate-binding protein